MILKLSDDTPGNTGILIEEGHAVDYYGGSKAELTRTTYEETEKDLCLKVKLHYQYKIN